MALQIGHAGRKGSTKLAWDGFDQPLDAGNWTLIAPSALPYIAGTSQVPREMTRAGMDRVKADFVAATRRAASADFDMVEFHVAHGYLMSVFISPLTNQRQDEYGGSLENRCRYPLEVFKAMREVWPQDEPMLVRISAHDRAPGGTTPDDATQVAKLFQDAGADIIHVSSGTIIAAGRADLCALARPHLADPAWTLHAAAEQGVKDIVWPKQYQGGKVQLERDLERAGQLALNA